MIVSMPNSWRAALVAALFAGACSDERPPGLATSTGGTRTVRDPASQSDGGDDDFPGTPPGGGGATAEDGRAGDASEYPSAGQPSSAGADDEGPGAGGKDGAGGAPAGQPYADPICSGSAEVSGAVKLAISTAEADQFGSITADELVIAWTVVVGENVILHYARRDSRDDELGDERTLEIPAAADAVTLSTDGLRVVYVNDDRKGFTQLVRASVAEAFDTVDSKDFTPIAETAPQFAADEYVGDPVLGPDDLTFYYSRYGANRSATLLSTLRFSAFAPWPAGSELAVAPGLQASMGERQRPTGVSLDGQTLFLWDSVNASQRVAMLSHETSTFDVAFELGDVRGAAPNASCSRIYYDRDGDLWSADLR